MASWHTDAMTGQDEIGREQGSVSASRRWWERHGWLVGILVPLIPMALFLGAIALQDFGNERQCSSAGGHTDRVGGTFDDIFLVCRDNHGLIDKVYADEGGDADQDTKCIAQGGQLFHSQQQKGSMVMMCVIDGQTAWSVST